MKPFERKCRELIGLLKFNGIDANVELTQYGIQTNFTLDGNVYIYLTFSSWKNAYFYLVGVSRALSLINTKEGEC